MTIIVLALGTVMTLYWIFQIVFFLLHKRWTCKYLQSDQQDIKSPVSIIHPIKDLDHELRENLDSWAKQDYMGDTEHIFSFQDENDPAIPEVMAFILDNPSIFSKIIVNKPMQGINGKSSNMIYGLEASQFENCLFVDSDIRVKKDFLQKMIRPLADKNVGATTCGQINSGGKNFWTRFFTYFQNNETAFTWAFLTKLGVSLGITGAAYAIRKETLDKAGGLKKYGESLLEDFHLGHALSKMDYKLVLGPYVNCNVAEHEKEKSINYAKRIAMGLKMHIAQQLPVFVFLVFWYWCLLFVSISTGNADAILYSAVFIPIRMIHGLLQRIVTGNSISRYDFFIPLFFDWFAAFFLSAFVLFFKSSTSILWRGVDYQVKKGGYIEP